MEEIVARDFEKSLIKWFQELGINIREVDTEQVHRSLKPKPKAGGNP